MKRITLFILISFLLNSCIVRTESEKTDSDKAVARDSYRPNNSNDQVYLSFKINSLDKNSSVITQYDSTKIMFPLSMIDMINKSYKDCETCYGFESVSDTTVLLDFSKEYSISGFELIDINFDGKIDIRFPSEASCCTGNNVFYHTWLNKVDTFIYQNDLSQMPIWRVDRETRTILTGWHMSAYDFGSYTYKFKNDSLILIQEIKSELVHDTLIRKIEKRLIDNKWKSDTTTNKL